MIEIIIRGGNAMNDLIRVNLNENQEPIISGRELHDFLGVETP